MRTFAVRLNPDPRQGPWYSQYPTQREYAVIHLRAVMNGFHEAVNYLDEDGLVRGYLPPRHLRAMRDGKPFVLITVTAAGASKNGDRITGVQFMCQYRGTDNGDEGLPRCSPSRAAKLTFHYSCPSRLSLLFNCPLPNSRKLLLARGQHWGQGPTVELTEPSIAAQIIREAINEGCVTEDATRSAVRAIKSAHPSIDPYGPDSAFDISVGRLLDSRKKSNGNKNPRQKSIETQAYERDPRVAAYALRKAKGICGDCKKCAPFIRRVTGKPFLEVHHIHMLRDGGSDTINNVIALCPNCHRKRHYG